MNTLKLLGALAVLLALVNFFLGRPSEEEQIREKIRSACGPMRADPSSTADKVIIQQKDPTNHDRCVALFQEDGLVRQLSPRFGCQYQNVRPGSGPFQLACGDSRVTGYIFSVPARH